MSNNNPLSNGSPSSGKSINNTEKNEKYDFKNDSTLNDDSASNENPEEALIINVQENNKQKDITTASRSRAENPSAVPKDLESEDSTTTPRQYLHHGPESDVDGDDEDDGNSNHLTSVNSGGSNDMPLRKEICFIFIIISAQIITQACVAQSLAILHIIGNHFGVTDPGQLSWYVAAFSLTVGTFIISAGRLGDMYGHRRMFIAGYLWLSLWSLLAGISSFSNSSIFFNVCRGMQGIGCGIIIPNGMAILGRTYKPGFRRNLIFSAFGACAPSGFILGAVFSSLIAENISWAWAFWITAIVALVFSVLAFIVIPADDIHSMSSNLPDNNLQPTSSLSSRFLGIFQNFDILGALSAISGLILFNVAWNQGPVVGWSTPYVYVLLILGIILFAFFSYIEFHVLYPLVPLRGMSSSTVIVLGCVACGWAAFGTWLFYMWQFLILLRHHSPLGASVQFIPAAIFGTIASATTAVLFSRGIPTSVLMAISLLGFLIPSILLATLDVHQIYWAATFISIIIAPFGMDISFPAATILLSGSVARESQGIAASLVATVVNYSISIGLGMSGTVIRYISPGQDEQSLLKAIRSAAYLGIGLSVLGFGLAMLGIYVEQFRKRSRDRTSVNGE